MLKLMIVDDDEILRVGLVRNIPWEERGITVVGTARNGKEAVEKLSRLLPDIILSDVQMPFMDGLELAEYVSNTYPYIKLILLTAFEIFEYAQRALRYGVTSYILKYESNIRRGPNGSCKIRKREEGGGVGGRRVGTTKCEFRKRLVLESYGARRSKKAHDTVRVENRRGTIWRAGNEY